MFGTAKDLSLKPDFNPMSMELRKYLTDKGLNVCTAAHALSGGERSLSSAFGGVYPLEIVAGSLRMFGQGLKVCVEVSTMAADAGFVIGDEAIVAVAGSGRGADTAVVLRPQPACNILQTKIERIICKPSTI